MIPPVFRQTSLQIYNFRLLQLFVFLYTAFQLIDNLMYFLIFIFEFSAEHKYFSWTVFFT